MIQRIKYVQTLPLQQAAEYFCNDVLTYDEHNFLNLFRERYNMDETDFTQIMSGRFIPAGVVKSPAGYDKEQNIRLLVQMVIARYYMSPKNDNAMVEINTMIAQFAKGMRGINLTQEFMQQLFTLTENAMKKFRTNFAIPQMENHVIEHIL